jgi:anti-sigma regulatory factor (Ser/Thr protein kinase)
MMSDRAAAAKGRPESPPERLGPRTELEDLRATASALKGENSRLRAELGGLRWCRSAAVAAARIADGECVEVVLALDARAPGAARTIVVQILEGRVLASAVDSAQLVMSELVTNSLQHGGSPMDEVVVSVELMPAWFRVGVRDSGSDAVIAVQPPNLEAGGGFGLNLVQMLSERWGVERLAAGGTQVWAQLVRATA